MLFCHRGKLASFGIGCFLFASLIVFSLLPLCVVVRPFTSDDTFFVAVTGLSRYQVSGGGVLAHEERGFRHVIVRVYCLVPNEVPP